MHESLLHFQAKSLDAGNVLLALLNECAGVVDVSRVYCFVAEKLDLTERLLEGIIIPWDEFRVPGVYAMIQGLLPLHAIMANCGAARRVVVVQPHARIVVYDNAVQPGTDSSRPPVA